MTSTEDASALFNAKAYCKMGVFAKPSDTAEQAPAWPWHTWKLMRCML